MKPLIANQAQAPVETEESDDREDSAPDDQFTPEQSDQYDKAVIAAMRMLYEGGAIENVVQIVRTAGSIPDGLADATRQVITMLDEYTKGAIDEEVMIAMSTEVLGMVVEAVSASGDPIPGRDIAQAVQKMLIDYITEQGADPQEIAQAMSQFDFNAIGAAIEQEIASGNKDGGMQQGPQQTMPSAAQGRMQPPPMGVTQK